METPQRSSLRPLPQAAPCHESLLGFVLAVFGCACFAGCCVLIGEEPRATAFLAVYLVHSVGLAAVGLSTLPLCVSSCRERHRSAQLLSASFIVSLLSAVSCIALLLLFWGLGLHEVNKLRFFGHHVLIFIALVLSLLLQLLLTLAHGFRSKETLRRLRLHLSQGAAAGHAIPQVVGQPGTVCQSLIGQQESANQIVPSAPPRSDVLPAEDLPPSYEAAMSMKPS